jgi:type III pantothenate kinase
MNTRHVLIDAGNTRLKWVIVADGQWQDHGNSDYSELSALASVLSAGMKCTIASVTRVDHEHQLKTLLTRFAIEPRWLAATAQFQDVINTYVNPAQLGVDRWMGMLAARLRSRSATLVVSAGTALTVDALSAEGHFLGGLIVPGRSMMQQSLLQGAARIGATLGDCQPFPRSTADAVHSGIIAALCGAVRQQHAELARRYGCEPRCVLTGGDALMLQPYLGLTAEHAPYLVLEGIDRVVREDVAG